MSSTIDNRVVGMEFDNRRFESNVQTSLSTLDKLKNALSFGNASKGFDNINKAASSVNMSMLQTAAESIGRKFSAMEVMAVTALSNITNSAVNAGKRLISALTIDPIKTGFTEYETQINAVQTILANTQSKGTTLDDVNAALDELNKYADKTIYNFTQMTRNIGTFTAAGVNLDTSVAAIKGIANLAAVSGSTSQQASTAMYQLSQALSSGTVKLMDWNSVVNAGMGGQVFQDALKETARVHGIAIDTMIEEEGSFRETLSKGWLTSEVLLETLSKFTGDLTEAELKNMGYTEDQIKEIIKLGETANNAATKVKTFTQLIDTLKEAAQSGWTQTWEIIVGDFEESKSLLTSFSDRISEIINQTSDIRNNLLQSWKDLGGRQALLESVNNTWEAISKFVSVFKNAVAEIFPKITYDQLYKMTVALRDFTLKLAISNDTADKLKRTFKGVFGLIDIVKSAFVSFVKSLKPLIKGVSGLGGTILSAGASFGDWVMKIRESIKVSGIFDKVFRKTISIISNALNKVQTSFARFISIVKEKVAIPGFQILIKALTILKKRIEQLGGVSNILSNAYFVVSTFASNAFKSLKKLIGILNTKIAIPGIHLVISAFSQLKKKIDELGGLSAIFGKIQNGVSSFAKSIKESLSKAFFVLKDRAITPSFTALETFIGFLSDKFKELGGISGITTKAMFGFKSVIKQISPIIVKVKDILGGVWDVLYTIGLNVVKIGKSIFNAFKEIFSGTTIVSIESIVKGLHDFAKIIALDEKSTDKLKRVFKGLFAVVDIVKMAIASFAKALIPLLSESDKLGGGILDITAKIGDLLVKLRDWIKENKVLDKVSSVIVQIVKTTCSAIMILSKVIRECISFIKNAAIATKSFITSIGEKIHLPGFENIHKMLEIIHQKMNGIGEAAGDMKSGVVVAFEIMGNAIANSKLYQLLQGIWKLVTTITTGIFRIINKITGGLIDKLQNINYDQLLDTIGTISFSALALSIVSFIKQIKEPLSGLGSIVEGVTGILDSVRDVFKAYQNEINSKALMNIAIAITLLTASIFVLSTIDTVKLEASLNAISMLFIELIAAMAIFTKMTGKITGISKAVTGVLGISLSILILASALKKIASLSPDELLTGIIGVATLATIVVSSAKILGKDSDSVIKGATQMIFFALALKILASVCKTLSSFSWNELEKGLIGIGALMAETVLFLKKIKVDEKLFSTAAGMVVMALAIKILASSCKTFANLNWDEIAKGLSSVAVLLLEIVAFTHLVGNSENLISTGIAMIAVAASMKIFASAISDFGSLAWNEIAKGLVAMAGALAIVTVAINLLPEDTIVKGIGLIAVSAALLIMTSALTKLGSMSWDGVAKGLVSLGGSLGLLAAGLHLMNGTLSGSAALLVASIALAVLAPVLSILGSMSWTAIAKGLVAIAGSLAIIGAAGLLLSPILPSILALAGAIALIGVGILAAGVGMLVAGAGLSALAVGLTALATAGSIGATAIVAALTVILTGVINLIPLLLTKIGEGIVAICGVLAGSASAIGEVVLAIILMLVDVVNGCIPQLVDCVIALLTTTLEKIAEYTPRIVQAVFDILIACLKGISDNISMVVEAAISIVVNLLNGIASKIPDVIQAGFNILLSFITGITDAIKTNTPLLVNAMKDLILALIDAIITVLTGGIDLFKEIGNRIMNNGLIKGIAEKVSSLISTCSNFMKEAWEAVKKKLSEWYNIGKNMVLGLINGIKDTVKGIGEALWKGIGGAVDKVKGLLGIHSPSTVFEDMGINCDKGFIGGINKFASKVSDSTLMVGKNAVNSMKTAISKISDVISDNVDADPVIRPVMDLSEIQNGTNRLYNLMNGVDGSVVSGSVRFANQAATSMHSNSKASSISSQNSILDGLLNTVKNLVENPAKFENTFNITGDNPKEIAEEVSRILQKQVERKSASWA